MMQWWDIYNRLAERRNAVRLKREEAVRVDTWNEVKNNLADEEHWLDSLMDEIDDAHGREHE